MKNQSILFALVVAVFASATPVFAKKAKEEAPKAPVAFDEDDAKALRKMSKEERKAALQKAEKDAAKYEFSDLSDGSENAGRFARAKNYVSTKWNNFKTEHPKAAPVVKGGAILTLVSAVAYGMYKLDQKTLNVVDRLKKYFGSAKPSINIDEELAASAKLEEEGKLAQTIAKLK